MRSGAADRLEAIGGAATTLGIEPDMMTLGKIIGGGYPIGVFLGKRVGAVRED